MLGVYLEAKTASTYRRSTLHAITTLINGIYYIRFSDFAPLQSPDKLLLLHFIRDAPVMV